MRLAFFAACALTALAVTRSAAASGIALETSVDARDVWLRAMPPITLHAPVDTPLRTLPPGDLPSTGSQQFLAFTWDTGVTVNDRWQVPLFGFQMGGAVGTSSEGVASLDGTLVHLRPWSSDILSFLLPGIGARAKERRWMFSAQVRPVVTLVWMNDLAAVGASSADVGPGQEAFALGLGARAELEVCRRIDPVQRACLLVSPALYEFSAMNGGSIGLRWEVGP